MQTIFLLLAALCGLGGFILWIMAVIAAFKKEEGPLMGILMIVLYFCGGIGAFILGWVKAGAWGTQKIMLWWTILIIAYIVFFFLGGGVAAIQANQDMQLTPQ